jgi:hypothetical protein
MTGAVPGPLFTQLPAPQPRSSRWLPVERQHLHLYRHARALRSIDHVTKVALACWPSHSTLRDHRPVSILARLSVDKPIVQAEMGGGPVTGLAT